MHCGRHVVEYFYYLNMPANIHPLAIHTVTPDYIADVERGEENIKVRVY